MQLSSPCIDIAGGPARDPNVEAGSLIGVVDEATPSAYFHTVHAAIARWVS